MVSGRDINLNHLHSFVLDARDTNLYPSKNLAVSKMYPHKYTIPIAFENKPLELIVIAINLNHLHLTKILLSNLQNYKNKNLQKHIRLVIPLEMKCKLSKNSKPKLT